MFLWAAFYNVDLECCMEGVSECRVKSTECTMYMPPAGKWRAGGREVLGYGKGDAVTIKNGHWAALEQTDHALGGRWMRCDGQGKILYYISLSGSPHWKWGPGLWAAPIGDSIKSDFYWAGHTLSPALALFWSPKRMICCTEGKWNSVVSLHLYMHRETAF